MNSDKEIQELISVLGAFRGLASVVDLTGSILAAALGAGKKVLTCGNGGSASDASHLAEELTGRYRGDRRSLPGICLASDAALMSCIANDYGFEFVFSRQIEGLAKAGDVVVVFSTSGNSANCLRAVEAAKAVGAASIALLGKGGGALAGRADYEVVVPSANTARIQEVHTVILHSWLELIENEL